MIKCNVSNVAIEITETETLTAGRVGLECQFTFSSEWNGLAITAYFLGETTNAVVVSGNTVVVPAASMVAPGYKLYVGVVGRDAQGNIVIPTLWASAGKIKTSPGEEEEPTPSPDVVAQIQLMAINAVNTANAAMQVITDHYEEIEEVGTEQVAAVNSAGTTQTGNVNTAGATQVAAVQAKGEEVLETIPEDYTTLSNDVSDLKSALESKAFDIGSYNRFDFSKISHGVIAKTGAFVADTYWYVTEYIPVSPGENIYASGNNVANFALFDANYQVVANDSNWSNPFTVPATVQFIRLTMYPENIDKAFVSTERNFDEFQGIVPYFRKLQDETYGIFQEGNLIDITALVPNRAVNGAVDGNLISANEFSATGFIPVTAGREYYSNQNYVFRGYAAFYDENKTYISGYGNGAGLFWSNPVVAPAGAKFARFTVLPNGASNAWISEINRMSSKPIPYSTAIVKRNYFVPNNPTEYGGNEISVFTKILCIGDSLTDGFFNENMGTRLVMRNRAYPAKLQALTGIECVNMGESGMTSAQWFATHGNDDLSGYDCCIIQLGVNDQLQNVSEADMNTALTSIINKVKADNKGIKIFVATIIPANGYMTASMRTRSAMIRTFVEGLSDGDVALVDLWTYGNTDNYLAYDAGHLTALGYLRLAEDYKAYISWIIHSNINDFRYVQFVGTNYAYSGQTYVREIEYN